MSRHRTSPAAAERGTAPCTMVTANVGGEMHQVPLMLTWTKDSSPRTYRHSNNHKPLPMWTRMSTVVTTGRTSRATRSQCGVGSTKVISNVGLPPPRLLRNMPQHGTGGWCCPLLMLSKGDLSTSRHYSSFIHSIALSNSLPQTIL